MMQVESVINSMTVTVTVRRLETLLVGLVCRLNNSTPVIFENFEDLS